jgi:hypothetical protein
VSALSRGDEDEDEDKGGFRRRNYVVGGRWKAGGGRLID